MGEERVGVGDGKFQIFSKLRKYVQLHQNSWQAADMLSSLRAIDYRMWIKKMTILSI